MDGGSQGGVQLGGARSTRLQRRSLTMGVFVTMLGATSLSSTYTHAAIYRCGNTYSNVPCESAKEVAAPAMAAKERVPGDVVCQRDIRRYIAFKDPDSVKVERIVGPVAGEFVVAGKTIITNRYDMRVNAKNSMGAYVGTKHYACHLSRANGEVLGFE